MIHMPYKYFMFVFLGLMAKYISAQSFEPQSGTLHAVNQTFHDDYNQLVQYEIAHLGDDTHPVMVFAGDTLIFKYRNTREAVRIIPLTYHQLKAIDHLTLGIFTLVTSWPEGKISAEHLTQLKSHEALCTQLLQELKSYGFADSTLRRQEKLVEGSRHYLRALMNEKVYHPSARNQFAKSSQQALLVNADEAARLELMNLHRQVSVWRKQLDTAAFHRLYVVIGSSHQARYRELTVQYFDRILNEQSDGSAESENQLVFAESVFNEAGCMSMLARHVIDQEIGWQFFNDRYRMQRDLLSDSAAKYLRLIFPEEKK